MMNRFIHPRSTHTRPLLLLALGALSTFSIVSGILPTPLQAQQPPGDMAQYTNVAQQIERARMQNYAEVKRLMGGNVPANVCQRGDIPSQVKDICSRFDSSSREIIQRNGMSVSKFNEITRFCQQSPKPKECPL